MLLFFLQKYFLSGEISKYLIEKTSSVQKNYTGVTVWNVPKYPIFSGRYFPAFRLNTERYFISLCIKPECGKIRTWKNSLFGQFSCSVYFWNRCLKAIDLFYKQTNGLIYRLNGLFSSGLDDNFLKIQKFI